MSGSIQLVDGKLEIYRDIHDFVKIVNDNLGYEAAHTVLGLVSQADYTSRKVETDLGSYESSLESMRYGLNDILDNVELIRFELAAGRPNKPRLLQLISQIKLEISNHL